MLRPEVRSPMTLFTSSVPLSQIYIFWGKTIFKNVGSRFGSLNLNLSTCLDQEKPRLTFILQEAQQSRFPSSPSKHVPLLISCTSTPWRPSASVGTQSFKFNKYTHKLINSVEQPGSLAVASKMTFQVGFAQSSF